MTRLILDVSTLARWAGPPVGMVRVESELARFVRSRQIPCDLVFFDPARKLFRSLKPEWTDALIGWLAAVDTLGIDYELHRTGLKRLVPSRLRLVQALERKRLLTRSAVVARGAGALQGVVLSLRGHDFPFKDAHGRRISLVPGDLALGEPVLPARGDVIFSAASDWSRKDPAALAALTRATGCTMTVVCYDIIPITHPQFFRAEDVEHFRRYWDGMFSGADKVIVNSCAIRDDIVRYRSAAGLAAPPIGIVPLGCQPAGSPEFAGPLPAGLRPGNFALFISTIEPRKNHAMLLDVWERLLARGVPQAHGYNLVFVGRPGWMVEEVLRRLAPRGAFANTVVHLRQVGDAMLRTLVEAAGFCLYPSLYEGFGLPVVEAFASGKPVIASNGGALRETAGQTCPTLDPTDAPAWEAMIGAWIEDPALRRAAERKVRVTFKPVTWNETAREMLREAGFG